MKHIFNVAILAALTGAPAVQAQSMMTASALANAATCTQVVFITDAGKEGLFAPTAGSSSSANNGTTLPCKTGLYKRIYDGGAVNAKWFGLSEGVADNSTAVQNAINAVSDNQELLIPEGTYKFTSPIRLPATRIIRLTSRGTMNFIGSDGIIVEGERGHVLDIARLAGAPWVSSPPYDSYTGSAITLLNAQYATVKVRWIEGFRNAIKLTGQGQNGSQYNKIDFDKLYHNDIGLLLTTEGDGLKNWVNENTFTGGRIIGRTGLHATPGSGQTDPFNGNKFYNVGFEDVTNGVDVDSFSSNMFIASRVERATNGFKFSSTSQDNTIIATYMYEDAFLSNNTPGNGGVRTLLLGRLLIPHPDSMISGVVSIADNEGRFLGLSRDPSPTVNGKTKARTLPLSTLPQVTP